MQKKLEVSGQSEVFFQDERYPTLLAKWYCSFFPVLFKVLSLTDGDIVELGTGIYSTPYLHWFCFSNERHLVSYENSEVYAKHASQYIDDFHTVCLCDSFNEINLEGKMDVVLIDSFPIEEREILIKKFSNHANYIVVHDSSPDMYAGLTKYRFDYTENSPTTSIFSDSVDLSNFKI